MKWKSRKRKSKKWNRRRRRRAASLSRRWEKEEEKIKEVDKMLLTRSYNDAIINVLAKGSPRYFQISPSYLVESFTGFVYS